MDIEGLGEKLSKELARQKLVTNIAEIYTLHEREEDLRRMDRMGEGRTNNLLNAIERSKSQPLSRLVFGLGIPGIGAEIAETLSRELKSLEDIMNTDEKTLSGIEGVGSELAKSILNWTGNEQNIRLVAEFEKRELTTEDDTPESATDHIVKGKTFVITGKLESFSRMEATNAVKALGAKTSGSVSKNTNYLVAGADAGSKLERANRLEVRVLNEDEFKDILDGKPPAEPQTSGQTSEVVSPKLL